MFLHTVTPPGPRHQRHLAPGAAPWLGALCTSVTLLLSPVITAVCRCVMSQYTDTCLSTDVSQHLHVWQEEVHAAGGGGGGPGDRPRLPLHLLRQPVAPSLHQADLQSGNSFAKLYISSQR